MNDERYFKVILSQLPLLYFPLNENENVNIAKDESGFGMNGTYNGARQVLNGNGYMNKCPSFQGSCFVGGIGKTPIPFLSVTGIVKLPDDLLNMDNDPYSRSIWMSDTKRQGVFYNAGFLVFYTLGNKVFTILYLFH